MKKKMVSDGSVTISDKKFYYEFWSDNSDVTVKIFHSGKKGNSIDYVRNDKLGLKKEMELNLRSAHIIK